MIAKSKILFIDIETSLCKGLFFPSRAPQFIPFNQVIDDTKVMCAAWKWRGDSKVYTTGGWGRHAYEGVSNWDDSDVVRTINDVINQADVVVGHNGDRFDISTLKARAFLLGLNPLTNITTIDTLKLTRKEFRLYSNKLDYLAQSLGLGSKINMEMQDWIDCYNGNDKALAKMIKYNKKDVVLLEKVYDRLEPYISKLPVRLHPDGNCNHCGSSDLTKYGFKTTLAGKYQKWKCGSCAHISADTKQVKNK